jgi:hypothetical protein
MIIKKSDTILEEEEVMAGTGSEEHMVTVRERNTEYVSSIHNKYQIEKENHP